MKYLVVFVLVLINIFALTQADSLETDGSRTPVKEIYKMEFKFDQPSVFYNFDYGRDDMKSQSRFPHLICQGSGCDAAQIHELVITDNFKKAHLIRNKAEGETDVILRKVIIWCQGEEGKHSWDSYVYQDSCDATVHLGKFKHSHLATDNVKLFFDHEGLPLKKVVEEHELKSHSNSGEHGEHEVDHTGSVFNAKFEEL